MKTSRILLALLVLAVLVGIAVHGQLLPASLSATEPASLTIQVDIQGAVQQPGLYELPYDARVEDIERYLVKNIIIDHFAYEGCSLWI